VRDVIDDVLTYLGVPPDQPGRDNRRVMAQ
jgi:hypothetical protein